MSASTLVAEPRSGTGLQRGEVSWWIVGSMLLGMAALVVLGVHPPAALDTLLHRAVAELEVPR